MDTEKRKLLRFSLIALGLALLAALLHPQKQRAQVAEQAEKPAEPASAAPIVPETRTPEPKADRAAPRPTRHRADRATRPTHHRPARHRKPRRVADLTVAQTRNARAIDDEGKALGVPYRGRLVAITTALQESQLHVYANPVVPASLHVPHQRMGYDHDSVGLFQQRVPMWGTAWQCMNPRNSAHLFYNALRGVQGWRYMPVGRAAQAVQGSAFPAAYFDDVRRAAWILRGLRA